MSWVWAALEGIVYFFAVNAALSLLILSEATFKAYRRRKQGLCAEYVVEGIRRKIIFCTRQTIDHKVHGFSTHSEIALIEDAQLREQGL